MSFHSVAPVMGSSVRKGRVVRAAVAVGAGIALVAVIAVVFVGDGVTGRALTEKSNAEASSASAKSAAPKVVLTTKAKATTAVVVLTASDRKHMRSKISSLKATVESEQAQASKLDKTVRDEEGTIKDVVLKAKKMEEEAIKANKKAVERKQKAKSMITEAKNMQTESKEAKKKFVAQETPMENASKLSARDHSTYRKAELAVAQTVTLLSAKPTDAKLLKNVHKLVKEAQQARKHMEKDHDMLTTLEQKIASLQVGKASSFSALLGKSVSIKKEAGVVFETVVALKDESAHLKAKAGADVAKVETEMTAPDKLHSEAQALRDKYSSQLKKISSIEATMKAADMPPAPAVKKTATKHAKPVVAVTGRDSKGSSANKKVKGTAKLSKDKERSQFLAGLFSAPWDKAGGQDHASI